MNPEKINVFIGYDNVEAVTFSVLAHSIHSRSSVPVSITPIMLSQLKPLMWRERHPLQSNDFSFSRFLVPYLSQYEGWSLFIDCDMIVLEDIANLWALRDDKYAVMCIKHDHKPKETKKYLGTPQSQYEKKNWSSVLLFNNKRCKSLSPEYVNTASGLELHQFKWLENDALIGELPHKWNHLVGYDAPNPNAALVHYTIGGPYFENYKNCEYSQEWFQEFMKMLNIKESEETLQKINALVQAKIN